MLIYEIFQTVSWETNRKKFSQEVFYSILWVTD